MTQGRTRRALVSVTDKSGVVEFARALHELGFSVLSTGGTFRVLQEAGVPAVEVAAYTGFPEMMDGRVKTLHPKIHGGLLARRDSPEDLESMGVHGIDPIDVLAVNLYRFREAARRPGAKRDEVVENIDIGGPAMIRSAAKNHRFVAVVVDPTDYGVVVDALREHGGSLPEALTRRLAGKAYAHTAAYDVAIAGWLGEERAAETGERFGDELAIAAKKLRDLRYGENPHQAAALYRDADSVGPSLAAARQLSGKELSYNNLLDLDAALGLALEFDEPACVIVKHNNPCGTAVAPTLAQAFTAALAADPLSAYGGIVALGKELDLETADRMVERGTFVEAIVAPSVAESALARLRDAKWGANVRVLSLDGRPGARRGERALRPIMGGFLVQDVDARIGDVPEGEVPTKRAPSAEERAALDFAWRVCKHVRSNAIVLARALGDGAYATVGVGAGQMSRVDSVEIACRKAGERARGAVLASDAFFPFADGLKAAIDAGATAAIQPGGSKRDDEVVAAADEGGLAMVFTGRRHFRH